MLRCLGTRNLGLAGRVTGLSAAQPLPRLPVSSLQLHSGAQSLPPFLPEQKRDFSRFQTRFPLRRDGSRGGLSAGARGFHNSGELRKDIDPEQVENWFPTEVSMTNALKNLVLVEQGQLDSDRVTHGNLVELYTDGDTAFSHIFSAIDAAQKTIWIEIYLWRNDKVGRAMFDRVLNALETRDVEVCIMYDSLGSLEAPGMRGALHELQRQHPQRVRVLAYNHWLRFFGPRTPGYSILSRNHRKLIVVDNFVAFTGSMNFGDEYGGPVVGGNGRFRDTVVRIEGPAVLHLSSAFLQSMYEAEHHLASGRVQAMLQERLVQIRLLSDAAQTASHYWLKRFYKARRQLQKAREMSVEDAWAGIGAFDPAKPSSEEVADDSPDVFSDSESEYSIKEALEPEGHPSQSRKRSPYDPHLARADRERLYTRGRKRWAQFKEQVGTKIRRRPRLPHREKLHRITSHGRSLTGSVQTSLQNWKSQRPWTFARRVRRSVLERRTRAWDQFLHSNPITRVSDYFQEYRKERRAQKYARQQQKLQEFEEERFGKDPDMLTENSETSDHIPETPEKDSEQMDHSIFRFLKAYQEPKVAPGKRIRSSGCVVEVLQSNPVIAPEIEARFTDIVNKTTGPIWIANPYFIPPRVFMDLLVGAAKGGRPVNIITCGISDVPFSRLAAHHVYQQLLVHPNIRIWQHSSVVIHSKTVVIGGVFSMVGSYNFDFMSHLKNAELSVAIVDAKLAEGLLRQYGRDLSQCEEVFPEELTVWTRMKYWTSYWMVRFVTLFVQLA